uniref:Cytochrome c oxidase subunit 4 n=1 Tax=Graphocephala atropunctata TaxID=36148 RepID=A0A1B6KVZ1_9HEMI
MFLSRVNLRAVVNKIPKIPLSSRPCSVSASEREVIGCRELVGFGRNGTPNYSDHPDFPFPAVRFLAENPYLQALREKEKGDWNSLSIVEKQCLYRASFCQTFSEMTAPTGEWKSIVGWTLTWLAVSIWLALFIRKFVMMPDLPPTFELERRQAQLQRMIDIANNPVYGIASKWDYNKNDWKK